jgi:hypothetical protein
MTTGKDPNLITHDFTNEERESVEKAYRIREAISATLLYSSVILALCSYIALRVGWMTPRSIVKSVFIISAIVAIVLILINGIHFIPGPPIR